jgi:solute:Na+ symporter, SSS family
VPRWISFAPGRWAAALLTLSLPAGEFPRELKCPPGSAPILDGVLAPGEWDDAARVEGPRGWVSQFSPVKDSKDLSFTVYTKHDQERLYFAFDVTDDVLYGIDTPRWLPDNNPKAHDLTTDGWPWFGDEVELLIHAGPRWKADESAAGNGFSWQMVCNLTKSRLGGIGAGGLLEGEPRSDPNAFDTYRRWIESGAMRAAAKPKPGGKGYIIEWSVRFNPCLEIEPGRFYELSQGDRAVGLNIAVGDLDRKETGAGNFGNFHHEDWFAGQKDVRTQLRYWGTLWIQSSRSAPAPR